MTPGPPKAGRRSVRAPRRERLARRAGRARGPGGRATSAGLGLRRGGGAAFCAALLACAPSEPAPETIEPLFVDTAAAAGLDFEHTNGATGAFNYPELMHSGCALLDYDGDGDLDVYLVQQGPYPPSPEGDANANRLYRNRGDGTFEETTREAGVGDRGYGTGVAAADYDGDGDVDLYVLNLGPNVLYRNEGDGTFRDVSVRAGVADPGYASSAAFVDVDGDGDLDLYVANYLDWSSAIERPCYGASGLRGYCSPDVYDRPQADVLFRNEGDGRFTDTSVASGIAGVRATGLGVATADLDGDGLVDIYVANDQMANLLWRNRGDGTFVDEALERGAALNEMGQAEAGMGVAVEDLDTDGDWDLFMVHLSGETNTFYRNLGGGQFSDATTALDLASPSLPYTGFGTGFFDYDCDGRLDLFVANGKVRLGDSLRYDYTEPNQLLRGEAGADGEPGSFRDVSAAAGEVFALREVSRGAAFGDVDGDGDVDILVSNNDGPPRLLRNQACGDRHWLSVELRDGGANRQGIGAVVEVSAGALRLRRQVQPAYSYSSSNDPRLHFGLGDAGLVERVIVTWPDGERQELRDVAADQFLLVERERARASGGEG